MNPTLDALRQKQQGLLQPLQAIDRLRRGSLSQQFFQSPDRPATRRGPYYVLQGFFRGKKFSERVPQDQAAQVQQDVDNYRRFQALAEDYVTLSDQLTRLQDQSPDSKKKLQPQEVVTAQFQETTAFLNVVRQNLALHGVANLEAVELGLRETLFKDGRALLQALYSQPDLRVPDRRQPVRGKMPSRPGQGSPDALWHHHGAPPLFFYDPQSRTGRFSARPGLGTGPELLARLGPPVRPGRRQGRLRVGQ